MKRVFSWFLSSKKKRHGKVSKQKKKKISGFGYDAK